MTEFQTCKKAEVHDPASGQVIQAAVSIGVMDSLLVTLPKEYRHNSAEPIQIVFFDPAEGLVTCRCTLTAPLDTEDHKHRSYRCKVLERLSREQRREDIKIPVSTPVTVTFEGDSGTVEAPGTLRDLSAGGIYLETPLELKPGDQLFFYYYEAGGTLPLTVEVLRAEMRPDRYSRPVQGYGCRFVDLASVYELRLRGYIFKNSKRR